MGGVSGMQSKGPSQDQPPSTRPPRGKVCGVENCGAITTKGKPYCVDHMELVQRADAIMGEVDARRREIEDVLGGGPEGWKKVNIDGSVAREIVEVVRMFGAQTMPKLTKIVQLKRDIVAPYVRALVACGRLRVGLMHAGGRSLTEVVSSA